MNKILRTTLVGSALAIAAAAPAAAQADTTPPAPVGDLNAFWYDNAEDILLRWSASADDGSASASGPVAGYSLLYSGAPFTAASAGTASTWWQDPLPVTSGTPGTEQTFTVGPLPRFDSSGNEVTWHFAVKAKDSSDNWSAVSNVVAPIDDAEEHDSEKRLCQASGSGATRAAGIVAVLLLAALRRR